MIDEAGYRAWKLEVLGSDREIWHDGLATGAVTRLAGEERERALAFLRFGVAAGDGHAAEALAAMGDVASRGEILARLEASRGAGRVRAALAAHGLEPDPALARHLVEELRGAPSWGDRIEAAIGLREFAGPGDEAALLDAIADPEYLVRYHAAESLLARWRAEPREIAAHREVFARLVDLEGAARATPERLAEARDLLLGLRPAS